MIQADSDTGYETTQRLVSCNSYHNDKAWQIIARKRRPGVALKVMRLHYFQSVFRCSSHTQNDKFSFHSGFLFQRLQLVCHKVLFVQQCHETLFQMTHFWVFFSLSTKETQGIQDKCYKYQHSTSLKHKKVVSQTVVWYFVLNNKKINLPTSSPLDVGSATSTN